MKRARTIFRWTLFVLFAFALDVVAVLHLPETNEFARFMLEKGLNERFKGDVEVGSLDYSLGGSLKIANIRFKASEETLLDVGKVEVTLDRLPLNRSVDVASVEIAGVRVRQGAGLPRLEDLFIPSDKTDVERLSDVSLRVGTLRVSDVNVEDLRPDGTLIKVSNLTLEGSVELDGGEAQFELGIPKGDGAVEIRRSDGAIFRLNDLQLALKGTGVTQSRRITLALGPHKVPLYVEVPGLESQNGVLGVEALNVSLDPESAVVDLKGLDAVDLSLDRLSATLRIGADRSLRGEQSLKLEGLEISRRIINEATGRDAADGPVRVDLEGRGPSEKINLKGLIKTARGVMNLAGVLNLSQPQRPVYELKLSGTNIAPQKGEDTEGADIEVSVVGEGILPGETDATLTMNIKADRFGLPIDEVSVQAKTDGKNVDLEIEVLDQRIKIQATRDPETDNFTMHLTSGAELTALVGKLQRAGLFKAPPVPLFGDDLKVDITAEGALPDGPGLIPQVQIKGDVSAQGVRSGPNSIDYVTLSTDIRLDGGKPKGSIELRFDEVRAGLVRFKQIQLRILLDGDAYVVEGSIIAPNKRRVGSFRVHGKVDLASGNLSATLDSLEFHHEALNVSLHKPVTFEVPAGLELTKKPLVVPPIRLSVGDGWVDAQGTLYFGSQKMEGQDHEVLLLTDSDIKLTLHRIAPILPVARLVRLTGGGKPRISGDIRLQGRPDKPRATLALRTELGRYKVVSSGKVSDRHVELQMEMKRRHGGRVGSLNFEAPLYLKRPQPLGPIALNWSLERVELGNFINLKELGLGADAQLRGEGLVRGTVLKPKGEWNVHVTGSKGTRIPAFDVHSRGRIVSPGGRVAVSLTNEQRVDGLPLVETTANLRFSKSPLLHPNATISGDFDLAPVSLSKLGKLGLRGTAALHGSFQKRGRRLRLNAELKATGVRHPKLARPLDVSTKVSLDKEGLTVSGALLSASHRLFEWTGGVQGDLLRAARRKRQARLPLTFELTTPGLSMKSLRSLIPSIPELQGGLSGGLSVTGTVGSPVARGTGEWSGFKAASGDEGRVALKLNVDKEKASLDLHVGSDDGAGPLSLETTVTPGADSLLDVVSVLQARKVRIDRLIPASLVKLKSKALGGQLDGQFNFGMQIKPGSTDVHVVDARGAMRVDLEHLPVPGTSRVFKGIHALIHAKKDGLEIGPMVITESDVQETDRRLTLKGKLHWDGFKPTEFRGEMKLRKWLGGGPLYAPHAQLDADIALSAELDRAVPRVVVDFTSFRHQGPKRFLRDHYQEVFGNNDVVFIDDERQIGKLPSSKVPFPFNIPAAGSGGTPEITLPSLDLRLVFSKPAYLNNVPLLIHFTGALDLAIRPDGISGSGGLQVSKGSLGLMGHPFEFKRGGITIDGPIISGAANLTFERRPHPLACRDGRSGSDGCEPVEATLNITPMGGIKLFFRGASGPYMVDAMALQNSGHARWMSGPGQSASSTVQFPQTDDYLIISWVMGNVDHLSGLDRYRAWADPFSLETYGQITSYEGQRLLSGGKQRLRLRGRPDEPGQNQVELGYDFLFKNTGRNLFGLGFHSGDELHTGAELFFEWSSER